MLLNGSSILSLLHEKQGRYILRTMDDHSMKEANGEEVETPALLLTARRIDELVEANQLVREGTNKYVLSN